MRSDFVAELGRQGFVAPGASRPVWTGRDLEELDDDRLYANGIPAERGPIRELIAGLSGGRQPVS